jgi:E3 ubiquitin-protein ligase HERC1
MTDMQICEGNKELLPGDPLCAPVTSVVMEANISMVRRLHQSETWGPTINRKIIDQLTKIKELEKSHKLDGKLLQGGMLQSTEGSSFS